MLCRSDQIEVLRFWEEIELFTLPDYRLEQNERMQNFEWREGRLVGSETGAVSAWQTLRWKGPFEYPKKPPQGILEAEMPFFTVFVGVIPKRAAYDRILAEVKADETRRALGATSPAKASSTPSPPDWWVETSFSSSATDADLRGNTFLASFMLNPWGKYVDESFRVAGFVGALTHLRLMGAAQLTQPQAEETGLVEGALYRADRIERWFETFVARELGHSAVDPLTVLSEQAVEVQGEPYVHLSDPHGEAQPMPEGFPGAVMRKIASDAGFDVDGALFKSSVYVRLVRPTQRRFTDAGLLGSFYLDDLMAARHQLEVAGAQDFDAADFDRLARQEGFAIDSDSAEDRAAQEDPKSQDSPETAARAAQSGEVCPASDDQPEIVLAQPIGAPLARLLALGASEDLPRLDILRNPRVLADLLKPEELPSGRWLTDPSHHLYLCQQAAVAGILRAGKGFGPLVSVNGPPGTGKSWLLRDVVAEIVSSRARRIAEKNYSREVFDFDREVSFEFGTNQTETFAPFAREVLGESLMVVASNNNAAIRNITDTLPRSYSLKRSVDDPQTRATRPAFSYWRSCALGMMALAADAPKAERVKRPSQGGALSKEPLQVTLLGEAQAAEKKRLSRKELFAKLLNRVDRPEDVWGLASATLGSRTNCLKFSRSVLGVGAINPFRSHMAQQLDDWAASLEFTRELPEAVWLRARDKFRELDAELEERRKAMSERLSAMPPPAAFDIPIESDPQQHKNSLWVDEEFEALRSALFEAALELHAATLLAQRDAAKKGLHAAGVYLNRGIASFTQGEATDVFEFLSFLVPVISTTLASASRLFAQVGSSKLAWVFIDEASQASPQSAAGLLNRAKRVVALGDPRQLMPVVTVPKALADFLLSRHATLSSVWSPHSSSLESLVDHTMEVGAVIHDSLSPQDVWTGLPLRTHRRCLSPMFDIANALSYAGQMVQMTPRPAAGSTIESCWYDIVGSSYEPHAARPRSVKLSSGARAVLAPKGDPKVIREEMAWTRELVKQMNRDAKLAGQSVFVLSPFRSVANAAARILRELNAQRIDVRAGTVHAFQGQEADLVILVLGSVPGVKGRRQRRWASSPANLVNVAVTRARRGLIVVGDFGEWTLERTFAIVGESLKRIPVEISPDAPVFKSDLAGAAREASPEIWQDAR